MQVLMLHYIIINGRSEFSYASFNGIFHIFYAQRSFYMSWGLLLSLAFADTAKWLQIFFPTIHSKTET